MNEDIDIIANNIDPSKFSGKRVMLIGSNGFLGRWFYDFFKSFSIETLCMDNNIASSDATFEYKQHNICESIPTEDRYDFIINCAGIASPEKYLKYPVETLDVSYVGTKNVLEYAKKVSVESVLMFSSSEVYGTPHKNAIPTKESYVGCIPTTSSRSCYDIGKQVLETLCDIYYKEHDVPVKVVRPFNVYGPHMGSKDNRVLSKWMKSCMGGEKIRIYGDGKQTRTFCYASDSISMMLGVLLDGKNGDIYNVGTNTPELNMVELAEKLYNTLGIEPNYEIIEYPGDYPADEPLRRCPNIDKVVNTTNIQPSTPLQTGLKKMYEYFRRGQ